MRKNIISCTWHDHLTRYHLASRRPHGKTFYRRLDGCEYSANEPNSDPGPITGAPRSKLLRLCALLIIASLFPRPARKPFSLDTATPDFSFTGSLRMLRSSYSSSSQPLAPERNCPENIEYYTDFSNAMSTTNTVTARLEHSHVWPLPALCRRLSLLLRH